MMRTRRSYSLRINVQCTIQILTLLEADDSLYFVADIFVLGPVSVSLRASQYIIFSALGHDSRKKKFCGLFFL